MDGARALWDDNAVTDHKIEKITAAIERIPGARIHFSKHAPEEIPKLENSSEQVKGGVPNLGWMNLTGWNGIAGAHTMAGLVAPRD